MTIPSTHAKRTEILEVSAETLASSLVMASHRGQPLDFKAGAARRRLKAQTLRTALLIAKDRADLYGLRLDGAHVTGDFDLSSLSLNLPLSFKDCVFDSTISLEGADLHLFEAIGCNMQSLMANCLHIRRDLDLTQSTFSAALSDPSTSLSTPASLWLSEARIGGRIFLASTKIAISTGRAIYGDHLQLTGNLRFVEGFYSNGEIRFIGAQIGGSVDFEGAKIESTDGRALDFGESTIAGSLIAMPSRTDNRPTEINGRVEFGNADIGGRVQFRSCKFRAPAGGEGHHRYSPSPKMPRPAIWAPRVRVRGDITFEGNCLIDGGVDFSMAEIGGSIDGGGQCFNNPADYAINAASATIGGSVLLSTQPSDADRTRVHGSLSLRGATVGGTVDLAHSQFSDPILRPTGLGPRPAIDGVGSTIASHLTLTNATIDGGYLSWSTSEIGGDIFLNGATISNQGNYTVRLSQSTISGSVFAGSDLEGHTFDSQGLMALNHVTVRGRVQFDGAVLNWSDPDGLALKQMNPYGAALEAIESEFGGGLTASWRSVHGLIDLTGATTTYLADNPKNWGDGIRISGFRYERYRSLLDADPTSEGSWDASSRSEWLATQRPFDLGPFEHAASVLSQRGMRTEAEDLLIAGRKQQRKARTGARGWKTHDITDWLFEHLLGYGLRPVRATVALVVLFLLSTFVAQGAYSSGILRATDETGLLYFQAADGKHGSVDCGAGQVTCFSSLLFGIDNVVPIVDLGQVSEWHPFTGSWKGVATQYTLAILRGLGWTFSAVAALTFSRLGR